MAFKEISDLNAETVVSLGGVNKKTGKANPKSIEGYYLGSKQVADKKKKTGTSFIYILQTAKGNVGVWGKTDLDRKMEQAPIGTMLRLTHTGMRPTPNGEMYTYSVAADAENTIEVATLPVGATTAGPISYADERYEETEENSDFEESPADEDEEETAYSQPAKTAVSASANKAKLNELLARKKK